jgi:hypothetical protein
VVVNRLCELVGSASARYAERMEINGGRAKACSQVRGTRKHSGGRLVPSVSKGVEVSRVHQIACFIRCAA